MSTLIIEDFKTGLDRRRMNETSLPGSLVVCENAQITRGGEIEKSEAFIRFVDLPENTYGLKAVSGGFMVFGSAAITPTLLKSNPPVRYQRLSDPGGIQSHSSFTVASQVATNTVTSVKVGATELLAGTATVTATPANFPAELAAAITANSGVSGYKAYAVGNVITVYAIAVGTAANGSAFGFTKTGAITLTAAGVFYGGTAATNPSMIRVLSVDLYDGKPYVIAEYNDGVVRHWYNGIKVADFVSGKGRANFSISAPDTAAAVQAIGSFYVANSDIGAIVSSITVGAKELLAAAIQYFDPGDSFDGEDKISIFPQQIADAINSNSNASGYKAEVVAGQKVAIMSAIPGAGPNGSVITPVSSGPITITNIINMAGGAEAKKVTAITVNGVSLFEASVTVEWAESNAQTAIAVAAAVNSNTVVSGYEAVSYGPEIQLRRTVDGTDANGHAVVITAEAPVVITPAATTIQGGSAALTIIEPGRFVKTMKHKTYVLSGSTMYYSSIDQPDQFKTGIGYGFDNMSTNTSGAEQLLSLANYFDNLAIFSRSTVLIWFVTDDPDQNQQLQVLNNTGTIAPNSVVEFGDNDVFFLAESGIRSLRARDTTNAAYVNDVGIAIDPLIQQEILSNNTAAEAAFGILEPRQGRYLLAIGSTVYAFSFFPSSKISAWSTYKPGFAIEAMDYQGQTIACRSRNAIYKIGSSTSREYDSRLTKVVTPFLSGSDPSLIKDFTGIDIACEGTWDIYAATDPLQVDEDGNPLEESFEIVGTITGTTYNEAGGENGHVAYEQSASHIALMLINRTPGYARIGNIAIHFAGGEKPQK